jgi:autophagy-related protein 18
MLNTSNLVILIGSSEFGDFSSRKVTIWSTNTNSVICSSGPFTSKIWLSKLNKKRMIICERNFIHIYLTGEMKVIHSLNIDYSPIGKIVLSPSDKNNYICFSCSSEEGLVKVYDLNYLSFKTSIKAHKSQISKLSINIKGDLLATSSTKGTIIRVFSIPKGEKLFTFKRGISSAIIHSINFNIDGDKMIITSETGTLHLFDLKNNENNE